MAKLGALVRTLVEHTDLPSKQIAIGRTLEGQVGRYDELALECHSTSDLVERVLRVAERAVPDLTLLGLADCYGPAV